MGIRRYVADSDTTITNAFEANLTTRGTGSNMGAADVLEVFTIHGQTSASVSATNAEQARVLIQFPVSGTNTAIETIHRDRTNGVIPTNGNVSFYLRMFNAPHAETLPENYDLDIKKMTAAWSEGRGLDMDEYQDIGFSNWIKRNSSTDWSAAGAEGNYDNITSTNFLIGDEDMEIDVTSTVEAWLSSPSSNYGFMIRNTNAQISGSTGSYYTKKFFGRGTEFFFKKPVIEARWDSSRKDQRANFILSSSLVSAANNVNTLWLYNRLRGALTDVPSLTSNTMDVRVYSASADGVPYGDPVTLIKSDGSSVTSVTAGRATEKGITLTGIYTASFTTANTASAFFDVWSTGSGDSKRTFHTGSFTPVSQEASISDPAVSYVSKITNLKSSYSTEEEPRLRVFAREKNWSPNIYTVATSEVAPTILDSAFYEVYRLTDDTVAIPYGTGSDNYTKLSYDKDGNYFDLDMTLLESGYAYGIRLAYYLQGQYKEQSEVFKFRVQD
jgi:hypothetical protein